jgi:hypothetical protein
MWRDGGRDQTNRTSTGIRIKCEPATEHPTDAGGNSDRENRCPSVANFLRRLWSVILAVLPIHAIQSELLAAER